MLKLKNYSTWRSHGHTKVNFYEEIDGSSENNNKSTHPGSDVLLSLIMQLLSSSSFARVGYCGNVQWWSSESAWGQVIIVNKFVAGSGRFRKVCLLFVFTEQTIYDFRRCVISSSFTYFLWIKSTGFQLFFSATTNTKQLLSIHNKGKYTIYGRNYTR